MTTRVVRDGNTNRIRTVESDNRSESHVMTHQDTDMGYDMRKNRIKEATGYDSSSMKYDLDQYDHAKERSGDTRYSESDRRRFEEKADRIKRENTFG
ncbi:MAG: hypothetical protein KJ906_03750 [Nanoarchaeota archaeon]|nr:hypothetical protein [Nanoarchaeota archaeon]